MAFNGRVANFAKHFFQSPQSVRLKHILSCSQNGVTSSVCKRKQNCIVVRFSSSRESVRVKMDDISFHLEKTGHGPHTLVLLPGALGSSTTDFSPQLEKMNKEKYTIYSFDPRGYGKSFPPKRDWPLEYLQRDAEDAVAVMKTCTSSKFSVLGWSDGGITGLVLASCYPQLVRKLVVWGCNSYISEKDLSLVEAVQDLDKWSARMREPFVEVYGEEYFKDMWNQFIRAFRRYFTERNGDICTEGLKNITCPTLILHGDKDPMVDPVHPAHLNSHIKHSRLHRMPEGKHNIHLRYSEEFNKLVEDFLDE